MDHWEAEAIPDEDLLYIRVHKNQVMNGEPILGVFKNRPVPLHPEKPSAMSTDWSRYATPWETRDRSRSSRPEDNGVISLEVGWVRRIYRQRVDHTPRFHQPEDPADPNNRAHADVAGPKSPKEATSAEERARLLEVRSEFQEISMWVIPAPTSGTS